MKTLFALLFFSLVSSLSAAPLVVVSVPPQKEVVQRIAGDTVDVDVLVPAGASPHFYEPTLKQILKTREGKVWFRIGEGFENMLLPALKGDMDVVDLREERDPHLWLSAKELKRQAKIVADVLSRKFPAHAAEFQANLVKYDSELDALDQEIRELFKDKRGRVLVVSHPAFYYFCRDYGCQQLSIESHGKEPSPKEVTRLIERAKALKIDRVYHLPQYSDRAIKRIARELGAKVVVVDPYDEHVTENLKTIATAFAK